MATREDVIEVLDRALALMNDEGAHWVQGSYHRRDYYGNDGDLYCSVGAISQVATGDPLTFSTWGFHSGGGDVAAEALYALMQAYTTYGSEEPHYIEEAVSRVTEWNDRPTTNWDKVVLRFKRAKSLVEKRGLREERLYGGVLHQR